MHFAVRNGDGFPKATECLLIVDSYHSHNSSTQEGYKHDIFGNHLLYLQQLTVTALQRFAIFLGSQFYDIQSKGGIVRSHMDEKEYNRNISLLYLTVLQNIRILQV